MDVQKIGKFIAVKRKEKKLTQVKLAEELGVTSKTISRWENGNYMPDLSLLIPLSEALEITLNELLNGESMEEFYAEEGIELSGKQEEKKMQVERKEAYEKEIARIQVDKGNRQVLEKTEIAIANTIIYSTEKIKRLKKWYLSLLTGVFIGIFLIVTLLHGVLYAEVPYTTGETGQWERLFQNHSSYDMGLTSQGKPVFISPGEALKKAESDYSDGIKAIQEKHNVLPFSKYTYKWYINYCDETEYSDSRVQAQIKGLKNFIDIYENSYQWKSILLQEKLNSMDKEELDMTLMQISFLLIVLGGLLLIVTLCTEGMACIGYFIYKGKTEAVVSSVEEHSIEKSKRLVEKQKQDGEYEAILATQDRSVHYVPWKMKGKKLAVIKWNTGESNWRARYPYLRKREIWEEGDTLELHYSLNRPWKYAVCDKHMWIVAGIKCVAYAGIVLIGILILVGSI